jgi:hypothetical protein
MPEQRRTLKDLASCRTAALGGHVLGCTECGHQQIAYNSCGNRHCPTCQATAAARWLEKQAAQLLPTPYFHVVGRSGFAAGWGEWAGVAEEEEIGHRKILV